MVVLQFHSFFDSQPTRPSDCGHNNLTSIGIIRYLTPAFKYCSFKIFCLPLCAVLTAARRPAGTDVEEGDNSIIDTTLWKFWPKARDKDVLFTISLLH
jgi:hypothetical protein